MSGSGSDAPPFARSSIRRAPSTLCWWRRGSVDEVYDVRWVGRWPFTRGPTACDLQVTGPPHVPSPNHRLRERARPEREVPRPPSRPSSQFGPLRSVAVVRIRAVTHAEVSTALREIAEGSDPNQPRSLVARGLALVRHVT